MSSREEQEQELEALEAIFEGEFVLLDGGNADASGSTARFQIALNDDSVSIKSRLVIKFSEAYPDEIPEISLLVDQGMSERKRAQLQEQIVKEAESQLGMPMVYALHSFAKEWITANIVASSGVLESETSEISFETRDLEAEKRSEASNMKFHGTPVTKETFEEWAAAFQKEQNAKAHIANASEENTEPRLTGRQLFEMNKAVVTEDSSSFWEEEAEAFADE